MGNDINGRCILRTKCVDDGKRAVKNVTAAPQHTPQHSAVRRFYIRKSYVELIMGNDINGRCILRTEYVRNGKRAVKNVAAASRHTPQRHTIL